MDYEEMSDFEISKEVAFAIRGRDAVCVIDTSIGKLVRIFNGSPKSEEDSGWVDFDPCNNPSDAWPIIVEGGISIDYWGEVWAADIQYRDRRGEIEFEYEDKNPLRAAMICFLKMKDSECKN